MELEKILLNTYTHTQKKNIWQEDEMSSQAIEI
jgi:hypothetical protein